MQGGRTAHSTLNLPLDIAKQENPTCNISRASGRAQVLKACKLIMWDECTMAHKKAVDVTLRDLRGNDRLMGGALLLLCGDFRQTARHPKVNTGRRDPRMFKVFIFLETCSKDNFKAKHESKSGG
jgi:hypothetical protein